MGETDSQQVGLQSAYSDEQRDKDRAERNRYTALHLAQKNKEGSDAKGIVSEAEIFFEFLSK